MNIETQQIFETAKEIYKDKDFQTVREILEKLLRSNSNNVEVLTLLGNTYYCLENFNRSADVYKKIVQTQPWNTQCLFNLANVYSELECYDIAIELYQKVITINPDFLDSYNNLGFIYYHKMQDVHKAIVAYMRINTSDPNINRLIEYAHNEKYSRGNPSSMYLESIDLYKTIHDEGEKARGLRSEDTYPGYSLTKWVNDIKKLIDTTNSENILDYGSGKGNQYAIPVQSTDGKQWRNIKEYWNVDEIHCFDPGYEPFNQLPQKSFDGVVITDVLEHCPVEDVRWILEEIFDFANKFVFANIACFTARTTLPNNRNAHCTILPADWWEIILSKLSATFPHIKYVIIVEYVWIRPGENKIIHQFLSNFTDG